MPFVAGTALTAAQLNTMLVSAVGGVLLTSAMAGIASAASPNVTWDTEVSDPDAWHVAASATVTVPAGKGGRYLVSCQAAWSATPGAAPAIVCTVSGGTAYYEASVSGTAFSFFTQNLTFLRTFVAGDTLVFTAYQNSGSARNLNSRLEIAPA